jgi:hypothetical protein
MPSRLLTLVLYVYGVGGLAVSVPLMLLLGPAAHATNATTVRLFGAALFALAVGALAAAREPARQRIVLLMEIAFTALASLVLTFKVLIHHNHPGFDERDYLFLALSLASLLLLVALSLSTREETSEPADGGTDSGI